MSSHTCVLYYSLSSSCTKRHNNNNPTPQRGRPARRRHPRAALQRSVPPRGAAAGRRAAHALVVLFVGGSGPAADGHRRVMVAFREAHGISLREKLNKHRFTKMTNPIQADKLKFILAENVVCP